MPTIGTSSKPAYVYDAGTDTWIPIGPGEHTHAYVEKSTLTTTGDIIYASGANTPARLGIGSTNQVLTVSGGVPSWATPATVGNYTHIYASHSTTSFSNSVSTKVSFINENIDTLGEWASSRFTATNAGYYLVNAGVGTDPQALGGNTVFDTSIYKNGSNVFRGAVYSAFNVTGRLSARVSAVVYCAVNDYIEIYFQQNATSSTTGNADGPQTFVTIDRILT